MPAPAAPARRPAPPVDSNSGVPTSKPATPPRPTLQKQESSTRLSGNHSTTSVMNKTIALLQERQKEFRVAAVEAKRNGDIEQAKEYLKTFKGLESLLDVARGGLPVDLSTVSVLSFFFFASTIM